MKDRAVRLFTFLRELSEMRMKTIRSYESYEQVVWLSEIPLETGCHVYIWEGTVGSVKDSWVEIRKPKMLPPPPIPNSLQEWADPKGYNDSTLDRPRLLNTRIVEDVTSDETHGDSIKETTIISLEDYPEVIKQWDTYVTSKWIPWAKENRIHKQIQKVYTDLYTMYQHQQRMGESYEVVLGLGLLTWNTPSGQTIKRHLIVAQTQFSFDARVGRISVGPSMDGPNITLEQDMLEPDERPDTTEINLIDGLIEGLDEEITNQDAVDTILRSWINSLPSSLGYEQEITPVFTAESLPKVTLSPALILRRRTERSLVRAFKEIIEQIKKEESLPVGLEILVKDPEREEAQNGISDIDNPYPGVTSFEAEAIDEVLFPLPANDEQIEIAKQLQYQKGVLVQGPPGTGKSHTIANLVCHLLASGKRALITSHTARALVVLRDKIPKEISPLCVIALSDDAKSLRALEESVNGITEKHNNWNGPHNEAEIKHLQSEIDLKKREEVRALADLRTIREAETFKHSLKFGSYSGTLKTIAAQIRSEESDYSWVGVLPREDVDAPLSNDEAIELLELLRQFNPAYETEVVQFIPNVASLPVPSEFSAIAKNELSAKEKFTAYSDCKCIKEYALLDKLDKSTREHLQSVLDRLVMKVEQLSDEAFQWAKEAVYQVLAGQHLPLVELQELTNDHLESLSTLIHSSAEPQIAGLEGRDRKTVEFHARALLSHLEDGKSLGWWKLRPRVVSEGLYLIEETRVNGVLCSNTETLKSLLAWIELNDHIESLCKAWSSYHLLPTNAVYRVQKAEFESRLACLRRCLNLEADLIEAKNAISAIAGLAEPPWHNIDRVKAIQRVLVAISLDHLHKERSNEIDSLALTIERELSARSEIHPASFDYISAIKSRNVEEYAKTFQKLHDIHIRKMQLDRKQQLLDKLSSDASALSESLVLNPADKAWDNRLGSFVSAWHWACADRWIRRISNPAEQESLNHQVNQLRAKIQRLFAELASAKAWRYCLARLTDHESGHLRAWQLAVRRIGRGTGVRVNEYRREARHHLEECRSAIPAWIMPIYRVAETIEMKPDIFDVVIVDEASQSGPEALFLQYIAKKIVVVGDSKQISPQFIGMDKDNVALLRQRLISDIPYNDALGIEHSFFDQAFIRYKGQICLREHFRCMPEIIQFSNNLCYSSTPLIPLKQFGAGRLTPTVGVKHVPDGYQKGRSPRVTNPPEAEAIVSFIAKCCMDKRYDMKSIGVISLLGEEQGKLIYSMLLEKIGPTELEKRQLICGDAYAFQGDERHIIFLSMVSAPGEHRIGTLTSPDAEKRFNVAASRAKEQLWLFHSATLDDLSPECLRYRLLKYCQNPKVEPIGVPGHDIASLVNLAKTTRRDVVQPPLPFDSWFEVDVFIDIASRGYRVIPQLEVAGFRIDLIVEGIRGRLAVECDGDEWHGPEQYERDMARQRQLERSGYFFWRVRGSSYYRDPVAAMQSLWDTLSQMQIVPSAEEKLMSTKLPNSEPINSNTQSRESTSNSEYPKSHLNSNTIDIQADSLMPVKEKIELVLQCKPNNLFDTVENERVEDGFVESEQRTIEKLSVNKQNELPQDTKPQPNFPCCIEYKNWIPNTLPDPRIASLSQIANGLLDIVYVEGPIVCHRLYSIYVNACGIQRVGKQLRSLFNKATSKAVRDGLLKEENEHAIADQMHKIVRLPECPPILVRTRGDRTIEEVPPREIAALMQTLGNTDPDLLSDTEGLFRAVLDTYGLVRMTTNTRSILQKAYFLINIKA